MTNARLGSKITKPRRDDAACLIIAGRALPDYLLEPVFDRGRLRVAHSLTLEKRHRQRVRTGIRTARSVRYKWPVGL